MKNRYYLITRKSLVFLTMFCIPIFSTANENVKPDFSKMKSIDHANRVFTDGNKNFLVYFKNYYKKEASFYLEVPRLTQGYHYVSDQCVLDGSPNEKIIAYVKIDPKQEKWKDVRHAWIVDISSSSIITVKPKRVYCFNDAWGI